MGIIEEYRKRIYIWQVNSGFRQLEPWELGVEGRWLCPKEFRAEIELITPDWLSEEVENDYVTRCKSRCSNCGGRLRNSLFVCTGLLGNFDRFWAKVEEFQVPQLPNARASAKCGNYWRQSFLQFAS